MYSPCIKMLSKCCIFCFSLHTGLHLSEGNIGNEAGKKLWRKIVFNKKGSIFIGTTNQGIKEFELLKLEYKDVLTYNPDKTTIFVHDIFDVSKQEIWLPSLYHSGLCILCWIMERFSIHLWL